MLEIVFLWVQDQFRWKRIPSKETVYEKPVLSHFNESLTIIENEFFCRFATKVSTKLTVPGFLDRTVKMAVKYGTQNEQHLSWKCYNNTGVAWQGSEMVATESFQGRFEHAEGKTAFQAVNILVYFSSCARIFINEVNKLFKKV